MGQASGSVSQPSGVGMIFRSLPRLTSEKTSVRPELTSLKPEATFVLRPSRAECHSALHPRALFWSPVAEMHQIGIRKKIKFGTGYHTRQHNTYFTERCFRLELGAI
jgi:hypothetical protein